ncbi:MAG: hypothetical protein KBA71_05555 [Opitutaceae bacterium]|nr:hypothetical protein [Opitutaceae bacterium]
MASRGAQVYLNSIIAPYGRLTELRINSRQRSIKGVCLLHGDSAPIAITVGSYVIEGVGSKRILRVLECTCDRAWAQALLRNLVEGRSLELPAWAAAAL